MASHTVAHAFDLPVVFVTDRRTLHDLCRHLEAEERIGIDTEFVSERTYAPQLELIQIATRSRCALIDCQAVRDLHELFAVLANGKVEKILHAGQQDVELFARLSGQAPAPVIDLQIAAAMAGFGAQTGYAHLVERLIGVTLEKSETLTDWTRRPFTAAQVAYAVDDVRYILPLHDVLKKKLTDLRRWEWLREECARLAAPAAGSGREPAEAYLRVRGRGTLRARGLVVLRELAAWREEVAQERNKPRSSVIKDEGLVEIARKAPTTVGSLRALRAVRSRELDRCADDVVRRIARALESPREQWPQPEVHHRGPVATGVVELLQAVLRARAEQAEIAPSLLATSVELQQLAERHGGGNGDLPILKGWRREIVGEELVALLQGRASVAIDAKSGNLRVKTSRPAGATAHGDRE